MTVLPQLERELLAAHRRRRGHRWAAVLGRGLGRTRAGLAMAPSAAVVVAVVVVALTLHGAARHRATSQRPAVSPPSSRAVLLRGQPVTGAYAAGSSLYVAVQISPRGAPGILSELMRIDPVSGKVLAQWQPGCQFEHAVLRHGVLWVTTNDGGTTLLWRLDPVSLAVRDHTTMPGSAAPDSGTGSLAIAGGWLWVGTASTIDRVSLSDGQPTKVITVGGPGAPSGVDLAADANGRVLMASVEEGGATAAGTAHLQRRDPRTGALIATSQPFRGVSRPELGGVRSGYVWISEAGGLHGYVARLNVQSFTVPGLARALGTGHASNLVVPGTNGVQATLINGTLWVSDPAAGPARNYCADPITGRRRAAVALGRTTFLTADDRFVYSVGGAGADQLVRSPIDPRCRSDG